MAQARAVAGAPDEVLAAAWAVRAAEEAADGVAAGDAVLDGAGPGAAWGSRAGRVRWAPAESHRDPAARDRCP